MAFKPLIKQQLGPVLVNIDGHIDYSQYSRAELLDALQNIDSVSFPQNHRSLLAAIESLPRIESELSTPNDIPQERIIPVGKYGLIEILLAARVVRIVRLAMLILAGYFIYSVYEIASLGEAIRKGNILVKGQDVGYYTILGRDIMFGLFFLWMATLGVRAKVSGEGDGSSS